MKALVLSGGTGTRLRPFSFSMPKQLIPVANKPVLAYVLENIAAMGVTEVGIIVNHWAPEISEALGDGSRWGLRITFIPQDRPLGLAHTVILAREFLGEDDFVMYLGDSMLTDSLTEIAQEFRAVRPSAHVVVNKVSDPRAFGVVELDQDGSVVRMEEKPRHPRSDLALTGVYFFTSAVHRAIDSIETGARGELEITDAVQWLLTHGQDVRASQYGGYYKDTGRVEDVLECNRKVLEELRSSVTGEVDEASELIGTVVVDPGARVVRSRIEGPVIIGAGSLVEDSHVGPHTSIGDGCVLRGTYIDYSIALDGATISEVRGLHGSLIGRSAAVGVARPGEVGQRLVVGDHSRVEVAA